MRTIYILKVFLPITIIYPISIWSNKAIIFWNKTSGACVQKKIPYTYVQLTPIRVTGDFRLNSMKKQLEIRRKLTGTLFVSVKSLLTEYSAKTYLLCILPHNWDCKPIIVFNNHLETKNTQFLFISDYKTKKNSWISRQSFSSNYTPDKCTYLFFIFVCFSFFPFLSAMFSSIH